MRALRTSLFRRWPDQWSRPLGLITVLAASMALGMAASAAAADSVPASGAAVDFSRDVLPILSDKCFRCHGPDAGARKADLRLDRAEAALRKQDPVIVPGKSSESELIFRIESDDAEELMPPPKSNLSLSAREVEILKRWVDQGAEWGKHWAFVPPKRQAPPKTRHDDRARNGIDHFVLARLEREDLPPAPDATRETLIRRVTLDLTGLPPTPAEIDAFLADPAADAYEQVVDRLLASPRYGERMATTWLDLARYADTHGYQSDRYRPMWPWRDWVIRAFNNNQAFDDFLTWQLAGDLLPDATKEQRLATAFNRLHMQNEEGGVVEEEFRVSYVVDRVNTMATAFLGLTTECCRCHDHKYDPITQREFYSLFAFFQNIDESGQTSYFTSSMPVPTLLLSDDATDRKLADLERRIAAKEAELRQDRDAAGERFASWLAAKPTEQANVPPITGLVASFSFDEITGGKLANAVDPSKPANLADAPGLVAGRKGRAVELNGDNGVTFPGIGHFSRVDPFSICLDLEAPAPAPRYVVLHHSKAPIDAGSRGYEILLEDGRVAVGLHHMWPGNALKVVTRDPLPTGQWVHLAVTYDGSSRADGVVVSINGVAAPLTVIRDGLVKDITYEGGEPDLALGFRFRDNGFKGGRVDELQVYNRALTPLEVAHLAGQDDLTRAWTTAPAELTASQRAGLLDLFLARSDPHAQEQAAALHALRLEQSRLVNPIPEAMVMKELPAPKPAFVLMRGAYDAPGDPVTAGTPAALPSFPSDEPRNRLGLAHWLLSPDHPLTARVTVNRLWQMMFGTGIVATSDNFGSQGAQPTHPELLDWLALEFIDSGWDVKRMLRLMATSSTYRQSSKASPDLRSRDPENQLLARGPARRLSAEMLRDQALAASGLLAERRGGPSVKPYQPDGLWEVTMSRLRYDRSTGPDLYRRSLYTFWKRTVPHPAMIAFDAAERNVCVVRRQSTSTPLQALTLLNDEQLVEAARHLGQRMLKEGGTHDGERVAWLFRLITGRRPKPNEVAILEQLLADQRAIFGSDPKAAEALLAVGETKSDPSLNVAELAAGTVLAEAILNHDEAVFRR